MSDWPPQPSRHLFVTIMVILWSFIALLVFCMARDWLNF